MAVILLFFGPKRLPVLTHSLGKAYRNFRDGLAGVKDAKYRRLDPSTPDPLAQEVYSTSARDILGNSYDPDYTELKGDAKIGYTTSPELKFTLLGGVKDRDYAAKRAAFSDGQSSGDTAPTLAVVAAGKDGIWKF